MNFKNFVILLIILFFKYLINVIVKTMFCLQLQNYTIQISSLRCFYGTCIYLHFSFDLFFLQTLLEYLYWPILNFFPPYINNISTRKSSWYDTTQQRITIDRRTADFVQNTVIHYTEHHCLKSLIMCWGKECIPEMIKYIIVKWVKLTWNGWTRTINQFKSFLCSIIWTQIIVML